MAADFRRRFWISLVLTLPILALSPLLQTLVGLGEDVGFTGDLYVLFGFSSAVFWYGGGPFLKGLTTELKCRSWLRHAAESVRWRTRFAAANQRSIGAGLAVGALSHRHGQHRGAKWVWTVARVRVLHAGDDGEPVAGTWRRRWLCGPRVPRSVALAS